MATLKTGATKKTVARTLGQIRIITARMFFANHQKLYLLKARFLMAKSVAQPITGELPTAPPSTGQLREALLGVVSMAVETTQPWGEKMMATILWRLSILKIHWKINFRSAKPLFNTGESLILYLPPGFRINKIQQAKP